MPIRFPGQYFDSESGLHENWNRYYDAHTGQYLSPDPVLPSPKHLDGVYAYAGNKPVSFSDPKGLEFIKFAGSEKDTKTLDEAIAAACSSKNDAVKEQCQAMSKKDGNRYVVFLNVPGVTQAAKEFAESAKEYFTGGISIPDQKTKTFTSIIDSARLKQVNDSGKMRPRNIGDVSDAEAVLHELGHDWSDHLGQSEADGKANSVLWQNVGRRPDQAPVNEHRELTAPVPY